MKTTLLTLLLVTSLTACQSPQPVIAELPPLPTRLPTLAPPVTATVMALPAETAVLRSLPPTYTPIAPASPTKPAPTPLSESAAARALAAIPTPAPVHTPLPATPLPDTIDRTCPEASPLKPTYARYFLSPAIWPTPDAQKSEPHFWLSKPLPGSGRFLINENYPYGWDMNGRLLLHNAVDSAGGLGTPVLAAADGTVVVAQSDMNAWYGWRCDWYGHLVVIEHDQRWFGQPIYTLYGHVLNINVEPGQRVQRGEQVAEVGIGGAATAPHLHFEVRIGQNAFTATRNPMLWIAPGEGRGMLAGRLLDPNGRPWHGVVLHLLDEKGQIVATTWSYLDDPLHYINPDEGLAENFLFSDVLAGAYRLYTELQGVIYQLPVTVIAGEVVPVELITEPLRSGRTEAATPTPTPDGE